MRTSSRGFLLAASLCSVLVQHGNQAQAQQTDVLTEHNDNFRSGANAAETILTRSSVNSQTFGKLHFWNTDGAVDAQPLYVHGLTIKGATHNVLVVASEHDTVYALDAGNGSVLWKHSLLKSGETTSDDHGCGQISPEIGVTSTPVIDRSKSTAGAIYVVSMSKDDGGKYHQRLNALDLLTGNQLFGGPTEIKATYSGTGDNSSGGKVVFDPGQYAERTGLLEWNGGIYTAWTSHCDNRPYTGWVMGYDASTLKQTTVLNLTPNGSEGAIWMGGGGLAATATEMLFLDGNGSFDTNIDANGYPTDQDYGNSFMELDLTSAGKLKVKDYYATDNTVAQSNADTDLGSGGVILFPAITDHAGNAHQLAAGAGKDGSLYVVDRENMGKYHSNGGSVYQVIEGALPNGEWETPAFYNNRLYYGGVSDNLKQFKFSNAKLVTTPVNHTPTTFGYPGTTPSVSSNQGSNTIVWALQHTNPAVLYAYNADDLSDELFNSKGKGVSGEVGKIDKFVSQTVVEGRVFVPTTTGIAVFGLLP